MESLVVECLRCGTSRVTHRDVFKNLDSPECQNCGYLGWQPLLEVTQTDRKRRTRIRKLSEQRRTSVA